MPVEKTFLGVSRVHARILLIDDSRFIRRLFTYVFEELGYTVQSAADGREGLRLAAEEPFDVIVVDGVLPDMDGRDVCRHIAAFPGERPILILYTASRRMQLERREAFRDGVDAFLRKDPTGQLLVAQVEELLAVRDRRRLRASA